MTRISPCELRLQHDLQDMKKFRMSSRKCVTLLSDIVKTHYPITFTMRASIKSLEGQYKNQTFEVIFTLIKFLLIFNHNYPISPPSVLLTNHEDIYHPLEGDSIVSIIGPDGKFLLASFTVFWSPVLTYILYLL